MRADASTLIGVGHVTRCLTIAETVRSRGGHVWFAGRSLAPHLRRWIAESGHDYADLGPGFSGEDHSVHGAWAEDRQAEDAAATAAALPGTSWDWIVVDHYKLDSSWQRAMRGTAKRVLTIDDMADRPHDADVLLDQNLPGDPARYARRVPPSCRLLLGPAFALVRSEFRRARADLRRRAGDVNRVLVFLGGGDAGNYTTPAVEACVAAGFGPGQVDVVIGEGHSHAVSIRAACERVGYTCHVHAPNMAELMAAADLAIGAAGSASWERCAMGLPTIAVSTAINQRAILEGLSASGAIVAMPVAADASALVRALKAARQDPAAMRRMSETASHLVDGAGVDRVVDVMEAA